MEGKVCVVPGCISHLKEGHRGGYSPYCSIYHEKLDATHHFAASKGYFYVEGSWGPPWPHLLQPSCHSSHQEDIWNYVAQIPSSPEIGILPIDLDEQEEELDIVDLTPQFEVSNPPPLIRTMSPKVETNDGSWQTKASFSKRKPSEFLSFEAPEWNKKSRFERQSSNLGAPFVLSSDQNSSEMKRKSPSGLSLHYKTPSSYSQPPRQQTGQRQLNISDYLRRR
jgi:hypothetical protein